MKQIYYVIFTVVLLTSTAVYAGKEETIHENNEYGGLIKQITYSEGEVNYKKGMNKIFIFYDNEGNKKKLEFYATDAFAENVGWHKKITYYWGKRKINEIYSTDSDSKKYGFYKMASYYNKNNLLEKREYYLKEDSLAAQLGVYKRVVYYDSKGRETKVEDVDRMGNVVVVD